MTLVDAHGVSRLAMQKAIRAAFATPEVRKMFEQQNTRALRARLAQLQEANRLNKIGADAYKYVLVAARLQRALATRATAGAAYDATLTRNTVWCTAPLRPTGTKQWRCWLR